MNALKTLTVLAFTFASAAGAWAASPHVGVGAKPEKGAQVLFDGSKEMLHSKWTYWKGPGFKSSLPIKWPIVEDPEDGGTVMMTDDRVSDGGKFGTADLVTVQEFRDFRLHVEFRIQVLDGDKTPHGMAAVINETPSPYHAYNGTGKWNAYDINFRAARFKEGKLVEKPLVSMYFNGQLVHTNITIQQIWGGANSGIDGGNDGGKGITDSPGGLKLQNEGHDVRYRNIWIRELNLKKADTRF